MKRLLATGLVAVGCLIVLIYLRSPARLAPVATAAPELPRIERTNLVLLEGRLVPKSSTGPFTGLMVEHYPDGSLMSRSAVSNGVLQGLSEGFFTNGVAQVAEHFVAGVSHGVRRKYYLSGQLLSEATIVEGRLHGSFRRWHDNGQLAEQMEFVADRAQGLSLAYFPSGSLKARVKLESGQPVEQVFWKDGEYQE